MGATLLVAAESQEFAGLLRHCRKARRLRWPVGYAASAELRGQKLLLVANGPGPVLAGQAVETACGRAEISAVVSTGFCGALEEAFASGEIFVASRIELSGGAFWPARVPEAQRPYRTGPLISVDRVILTQEEKRRLRRDGVLAVEMESAAVASAAHERALPFFCVRVVMDRADEGFSLDLNLLRDAQGRFSRPRIIWAALSNPRDVAPELVRLEKRCRLAARALGDFIADCRF